jgi:hypothetical protein
MNQVQHLKEYGCFLLRFSYAISGTDARLEARKLLGLKLDFIRNDSIGFEA